MSDRSVRDRADVVARIAQLRPLVEEHERLTGALVALETPSHILTADAAHTRRSRTLTGAARAARA